LDFSDLRWFRAIRSTWLFSERTMDWVKIQKIADGDVL